MPAETDYHAAAVDMLGLAERERVLPERAVDYPAAVVEWFLLGRLDELHLTGQRLTVGPGFYVYVDEGDDPPVYHDEEGLMSVSFSNFAFDLAAAERLRGQHLTATGPVPDAAALEWLGQQLKPGPVTRTDGVEIHRFYGPHEYATVRWAPEGEAEWSLQGDSEQTLAALRKLVDQAGGVAPRGPLSKLVRRTRKR